MSTRQVLVMSVCATVVLGLTVDASARTWHVPSECPTIQSGIDSAVAGDTVLVAAGTYTGDGNRDLDFGGKPMVVMSEGGPEATVIDCEGSPSDFHRGFYFHQGEDANSVVQGFTITNGYGQTGGGGISCYFASPTIRGNIITGNVGEEVGGGISCWGGWPKIEGNIITGNRVATNGLRAGGGIFYDDCDPTIKGNLISGNRAVSGGGIWCEGGTIEGNIIAENTAEGCGGGIFFWPGMITGNIIVDNTAGGGGGMCYFYARDDLGNPSHRSDASFATIDGNLIARNRSEHTSYAGGICLFGSAPDFVLTGNTIAENSGYEISCHHGLSATLINCILWGDSTESEIYVYGNSSVFASYSDIQGGWEGEGNIDVDPLFVEGPLGEFYLSQIAAGQTQQSPCVDAGDTSSPISEGTTRTDQADDVWPVDMGFHYWPSSVSQFIRGDVQADGHHDLFDGLRLLYWMGGAAPPPLCINAADADDDEDVDLFDGLRIVYWIGGQAEPPPAPCCAVEDSCGPDPTPGPLSCVGYLPCGWPPSGLAPRSMTPTVFVGSAEASRLEVGEVSVEGEIVEVPVILVNDWPLVGFSWVMEYDPELLTAVAVDDAGLITEGFDVFVGGVGEPGLVRVAAVSDVDVADGVEKLPAGEHQVARIVFEKKALGREISLKVANSVMAISHDRALNHHVEIKSVSRPAEFRLNQNYPNPFNPDTEIRYALPRTCQVKLEIFNVVGQRVVTVVDELQKAGYQRVTWEARNVAAGIYFYRISAGDFVKTRRMILLK